MDFHFNAYKADPNSPVVAFKSGGFGFNIQNEQASDNLFRNLKSFGDYVKKQQALANSDSQKNSSDTSK